MAAFAYATFTRLFTVQCIVALLTATILAWVFAARFLPVLHESARAAPVGAVIQNRALSSPGPPLQTLAANASLEILLDLRNSGARGGGSAEITIVLRESNALVCGFLGCAILPYPAGYTLSLSSHQVAPWWAAWRKFITGAFIVSVVLLQWCAWCIVATLLAAPLRMIAFFSDLNVSIAGTWRLISASMLPGCFVVSLGLALYGYGTIDLLRLFLFFGLYLLCTFFFIVTSLVFLSRLARQKGNPFSSGGHSDGPEKKAEENPFTPR